MNACALHGELSWDNIMSKLRAFNACKFNA